MFLRFQGKSWFKNLRHPKLCFPKLHVAPIGARFFNESATHTLSPQRCRLCWLWFPSVAGVFIGLGLRFSYELVKSDDEVDGRMYRAPINIQRNVMELTIEMPGYYETIRIIFRAFFLISVYLPLIYIITATYLAECFGFKDSMCYAWSYFVWATAKAGPMWIKFAQWAATRPDIFPPAFCKLCSQFHYYAPIHSWDESKEILSKSYSNWKNILIFENKTPIGSGCITQVYKAQLLIGREPQAVAVKIIHPWVREQMHIDLKLLRNLLKICLLLPKFRNYIHWSGINYSLQEFESMMVSQMDLSTEADNLKRFNDNFKHNPQIVFPRPYDNFVTRDILVESFEEGVPISEYFEADTETKEQIAAIGLVGFMQMVFVDGFLHDDLHPGNIFVKKDKGDYKLICLDCGIARSFEPNNMTNVSDIRNAIAKGEHAGKLIYELSPCNEQCENPEAFFREIRELVEEIDVFRLTFSGVCKHLCDIFDVCVEHKVQFEGNYLSLGVAAMLFESVSLHLLPNLNPNYYPRLKI